MQASQLMGAWDLTSFEVRHSDGSLSFPFGKDPMGRLMYDRSGCMSAQLVRRERSVFESGDQLAGTNEEIKSAFEGCVAYFGTFEIDETEGVVIHRIEGSMFPNWTDTEQRRFYDLEGDQLKIKTAPLKWGGGEAVGVLVWQRAA